MQEVSLDSVSLNPADEEILLLVGFRLDPDREDPEVYTLILEDEKDRPLVANDQILFFNKPELAPGALELSDPDFKRHGPPPKEVDLVCDVAECLYLITSENADPSATIINALNIIFDLVQATKLPMPAEYKRALYTFADHLTFHREFSDFANQPDMTRSILRDGILWCIGAVVSKARLLIG
jgi:hypothetical protein